MNYYPPALFVNDTANEFSITNYSSNATGLDLISLIQNADSNCGTLELFWIIPFVIIVVWVIMSFDRL